LLGLLTIVTPVWSLLINETSSTKPIKTKDA